MSEHLNDETYDDGEGSMDERLIEFIVQSLVEEPDAVEVYTKQTRRTDILKLQVASDGYGTRDRPKWSCCQCNAYTPSSRNS